MNSTNPSRFCPLGQVTELLEGTLAGSVADETELVWLQRRRGWASSRGTPEGSVENPILTVLIRVVEGQRLGWYRTESLDPHEHQRGIREAIALSRVQPTIKRRPLFPLSAEAPKTPVHLLDPEIENLDVPAARDFLRRHCHDHELGRLSWSDSRLAIFNSHGVRRSVAATEVSLELTSGYHPGAGRAAGSARKLADLDAEGICRRARACHSNGAVAALPTDAVPVLLAPEAAIELLNSLNTFAFSGRTYLDGTSFISRHRNVQVFDRRLNLHDDGTLACGLPFPFDLEGAIKAPLSLITNGTPSTAALNQYHGAEVGMRPNAQSVGGQDALCGNLFLQPGTTEPQELMRLAEGGFRVGWLDHPECFEPTQLHLRCIARGLRRIKDGQLGAALPDAVWEESALRAFAMLRGIGDDPVVLTTRSTPLGGISAPSLVIGDSSGFTALPDDPIAAEAQDRRSRTTV